MRITNQELSAVKRQVRDAAAEKRSAIQEAERAVWSAAACRYAIELLEQRNVQCFAVYAAFRSELETRSLIEWGWDRGITVLLPRTWPKQGRMEFYEAKGWPMLKKGSYGLLEPDPEQAAAFDIATGQIDVVFVPGLAFDRRGGRLGYGGGYYDRFRRRMAGADGQRVSQPPWIGLFFTIQEIDEVPMDSHDCWLDGIITESGLRLPNQAGKRGEGETRQA
ncbi:5-formyltetrahydrofolate cyclo-ligase [Paenibacillus sp. GCM10027626]|uniref:5-formyltetrahydrofolate cyclo-ligase n=1 Tax=Paenibacillus sp. GCM10027626 TaxID=3273411 RepID=UPI00364392D8